MPAKNKARNFVISTSDEYFRTWSVTDDVETWGHSVSLCEAVGNVSGCI